MKIWRTMGPSSSTRLRTPSPRGAADAALTNRTDAKLGRQAELCCATLALAPGEGGWQAERGAVSVEMVIGNLMKNVEMAQKVLATAVASTPAAAEKCKCQRALRSALVTDATLIPAAERTTLARLAEKYWNGTNQLFDQLLTPEDT